MALISQENQDLLRNKFSQELANNVSITVFTQGDLPSGVPAQDCIYCKETKQLAEEVSQLSDKIDLRVLDFAADKDQAKQMGVDKVPAILIDGNGTTGVRYFGIPSGYEFSSLVEDIIDVSKGRTDLSSDTKQALQGLTKDVHIQVFVTPT